MALQRIALLYLAAYSSTSAIRRSGFIKRRLQPLKVIVMAGEKSMRGWGEVDWGWNENRGTLKKLVTDDATREEFREATDGHGGWKTIKDVTIFTTAFKETGPLTVGYGASTDKIGVEFSFGIELYNHLRQKMLFIKTAWNGQTLGRDFRPPSAILKRGNPMEARLRDGAGERYSHMVTTIRDVLRNISSVVPDYDARGGYEISAFLWHQGWSDAAEDVHYDPEENVHYDLNDPVNLANEYEKNLADFIVDVRQSLKQEGLQVVDDLPFILGSCGYAGSPNNHKNEGEFDDNVAEGLRMIWTAYDRMARPDIHPEVGRVFTADSVPFARTKDQSPTSRGDRWWGNAETYYRLGKEMGRLAIQAIGEGLAATTTTTTTTRRRRHSKNRRRHTGKNGGPDKGKDGSPDKGKKGR